MPLQYDEIAVDISKLRDYCLSDSADVIKRACSGRPWGSAATMRQSFTTRF